MLDETGQTVLADSGELGIFTLAISVSPGGDALLESLGVVEELTIVVEEQQQSEEGAISSQRVVTRTSRLPAQGSLYGFDLGPEQTTVIERSNLAVEMSIIDQSGDLVGRVRLSQGPAYGADILRSVA